MVLILNSTIHGDNYLFIYCVTKNKNCFFNIEENILNYKFVLVSNECAILYTHDNVMRIVVVVYSR